ncbi:MAG: primosomal protein N' [Bacillota bacterium]
MYAQVLLPFGKTVSDFYTYAVSEDLERRIKKGQRVLVPFGGSIREGIVWELLAEKPRHGEVKNIAALLDERPYVNETWRQVAAWMGSHYLYSPGDALKCIIPAIVRGKWERTYHPDASRAEIEAAINECAAAGKSNRHITYEDIILPGFWRTAAGKKILPHLLKNGLIMEKYRLSEKSIKTRKMTAYRMTPDLVADQHGLTVKQKNLLEFIKKKGGLVLRGELKQAGFSPETAERLCRRNIIEKAMESQRRPPGVLTFSGKAENIPTLTGSQQKAWEIISASISKSRGEIFLLHGVTGSGKTELYLRALEEVKNRGGAGLYLVPEIALTPQTIERVTARLGEGIAVLHSGLGKGERYDEWFRIFNGAAKIAVGARSAIFAPFENLKLIILDEEHENTYKQDEYPFYHAKEIAEKLHDITGATLILGSATPSVVSYYRGNSGQYHILALHERVEGRLPRVEIIDLREEFKKGSRQIFSQKLLHAMENRLARKEQSILFLNRRGHSTFVFCRECGYAVRCPHCDVSLVYHLPLGSMQCHYCAYTAPPPVLCPNCKSHHIKFSGLGTQKIEEELRRHFPGARIARMDVDSTARKNASLRIYEKLKNGEIDILIGTQMVAKGLDLPRVTLVGVIMADTSLNIPDYQAGERTFQLLTQVAGRAGRGLIEGEVILQTFSPEHYSIKAAAQHDYERFYAQEILWRKAEQYPPFSEILKITVVGCLPEVAKQEAGKVAEKCHFMRKTLGYENDDFLSILGPNPSLIHKKHNKYWWIILLKGQRTRIIQVADAVLKDIPMKNGCYFLMDLNPAAVM